MMTGEKSVSSLPGALALSNPDRLFVILPYLACKLVLYAMCNNLLYATKQTLL